MRHKIALALVVAAVSSAPAFAQGEVWTSATSSSGGTDNAFEIGLAFGYAQGLGDFTDKGRPGLNDYAHGGGEVTLHLGWRINPNFLVGAYGSGAKYTTGWLADGGDVWSATAGAEANYHFLPGEQFDPWIGFGAGWRGHWVSLPAGTDSRHGIDFARFTAGVDVKVTNEFAVAPYLGASGTLFLTEELQSQGAFSNISSPRTTWFVGGGIMGRFDLFGSGASPARVASN